MLHINKPLPKFEDIVGIDIETSGLDPYQDRLLSIQIYDGADVYILLDFYGFEGIKELLEDEDIIKIAHNAKFEHQWLLHHLKARGTNWYDTQLADRVILTDPTESVALDECLARYGIALLKKDTRKTFEDHPGFAIKPVTNEQLAYMRDDVLYLIELHNQQTFYAAKYNLLRTVDLENSCVPAVSELEYNGICMDVDLWYQIVDQLNTILENSEKTAKSILSNFVAKVPSKKNKQDIIREIPADEINLNSPAQLKIVLKDRFGIDTDTTNKDFLQSLVNDYPDTEGAKFCEQILDRRFVVKQIGYAYHEYINPVTGRIHPDYWQLGARTGRFSCSNPNMQQVLRPSKDKPNVRHIFTADTPDHVIIRVDWAQQEVRIMAQMCQDPDMIAACNKEDVYIEFGKHIFGFDIQKGSEERHISKTFVLAVGYGAGVQRLTEASGKDAQTCSNIKTMIQSKFPIMAEYGKNMYGFYQRYGYVQTAIGRRRYIDDRFTEAVNTPIQGTAADMFKMALVIVHKGLTELKKCGKIEDSTRVWNLVHDEIEVHCHKDEVDFLLPLVKEWMEEAGRSICPDVLHIAEAEYGYRWDK